MYVGNGTEEPPPWIAPPRHLLPGVAPTTALLARTDDTVVALATIRAYPTGLEITLTVRTRRTTPDLFDQVSSRSHGEDHLRVAIAYPDGTTVTADHPDYPPDGPVFVPQQASGTDDAVDTTYWLWPLPPAGTLQLVCTWPARGIPETATVLDAGPLHDAAARTIRLWDPRTSEQP